MSSAVLAPIKKADPVTPNLPVSPQISQVTPAVGAGVTGATSGETPPPTGATADIGTALTSLLNKFVSGLVDAKVDPEVACCEAMSKILAAQGTSAMNEIIIGNATKKEVLAEKYAWAQKVLDELAQIMDASFWKDVKLVIEAAVAFASICAGAVLQVV